VPGDALSNHGHYYGRRGEEKMDQGDPQNRVFTDSIAVRRLSSDRGEGTG